MGSLKKLIIQIHNLSGTVLSLMFVVWFLSGFVLIYAGFPHASREERFLHLSYLTKSDFDSIQVPEHLSGKVELEKMNGQPVYRAYKGKKAQKVYKAVSLKAYGKTSQEEAVALAEDFVEANLATVEKIEELDQWMPWSYYKPLLPIYKCIMDDKEHTRIYISEKSGSIVQETTRASRWAGRLGAIPHWIYFRSLRLQKDLWAKIVMSIAFIGVLVSLSGLLAGFIRLRKRKKKEKLLGFTPYKKFWHKWHHITGFVFGLFVFTFILSGLVSVSNIPKWMVPVHSKISPKKAWNQSCDMSQFPKTSFTDLWNALENKSEIRKVAFKTVMNQPYFWVYRNNYEKADVYAAGYSGVHRKANYSKSELESWCKNIFPDLDYNLQEQKDFDAYYQPSGMSARPLPVWQLNLEDEDNTRMYIDAKTGEVLKSYNNNDRWRRWSYRSLHAFDFPFLKKHDWLRKLILIFLSIGGTAVSISGFALGIKWIKRKSKKKKSQRMYS
ncbi:PepSY domain-containing protein [Marinifilum sp. RC60d5]|uniref:PepSY domain-containing protein n=1 Tax=Marinifilum sp. RC60d5 TaxID=3458414 RepID=UPI00403570F2